METVVSRELEEKELLEEPKATGIPQDETRGNRLVGKERNYGFDGSSQRKNGGGDLKGRTKS